MSAFSRADPVALKKAGNAAFGKGKYAEAVEHYTAAIDLWMEPADRAVLYSNRSAAKLKLPGERQKALSDATRACELAPEYAKAHFRRGQALRALGDPEPAVAAMERVLALSPADAAATAELAELRGALGGPSKPSLSGSLQPGVHVAPSYAKTASGAPPKPFALPKEDSAFVRPVERVPGRKTNERGDRELFVSQTDFAQVAPTRRSNAVFPSEGRRRRAPWRQPMRRSARRPPSSSLCLSASHPRTPPRHPLPILLPIPRPSPGHPRAIPRPSPGHPRASATFHGLPLTSPLKSPSNLPQPPGQRRLGRDALLRPHRRGQGQARGRRRRVEAAQES